MRCGALAVRVRSGRTDNHPLRAFFCYATRQLVQMSYELAIRLWSRLGPKYRSGVVFNSNLMVSPGLGNCSCFVSRSVRPSRGD